MKNPILAASHQSVVELMAAGCPVDYPDALRTSSDVQRKPFRAEPLPGYIESRAYAYLNQTDFVFALRLRTDDSRGTLITDCRFLPPSEDPFINWDYEPQDLIPRKHQDEFKSLLRSNLMDLVTEGRLLRRGYPADCLLCARLFKGIRDTSQGYAYVELVLTDEFGNNVPVRIDLRIDRLSLPRKHATPVLTGASPDVRKNVELFNHNNK